MDFTPQEQIKIDFIMSFLNDYDTIHYDQYKQAIIKDGDAIEYWLCDDDKCVEAAKKHLRKGLPKYSRLSIERVSNDGDHESFEICNVCGKHLNKYLTWYEDELDYLIEECNSFDDIIGDNAFKIVGILSSVGWLSDCLNSEKAKVKLLNFINKIADFIPAITK